MTYGATDSLQIVHITTYKAKENIPCSIGIKASISYWYLATYDKCLTFAFVNERAIGKANLLHLEQKDILRNVYLLWSTHFQRQYGIPSLFPRRNWLDCMRKCLYRRVRLFWQFKALNDLTHLLCTLHLFKIQENRGEVWERANA